MARRKVEVSNPRDCGDGLHRVVSVKTQDKEGMVHRKVPCEECPWRKDAPIGRFPAEAYRHSASTSYDMAQSMFSCHMQPPEGPAICAGFLNVNADNNLAVRLAIAAGRFDFADLPVSPVALYGSYREMAEANGVPADDDALLLCRSNKR